MPPHLRLDWARRTRVESKMNRSNVLSAFFLGEFMANLKENKKKKNWANDDSSFYIN